MKNKSYKFIFEQVERIAKSQQFTDKKGDVSEIQQKVEAVNPIGSDKPNKKADPVQQDKQQ